MEGSKGGGEKRDEVAFFRVLAFAVLVLHGAQPGSLSLEEMEAAFFFLSSDDF